MGDHPFSLRLVHPSIITICFFVSCISLNSFASTQQGNSSVNPSVTGSFVTGSFDSRLKSIEKSFVETQDWPRFIAESQSLIAEQPDNSTQVVSVLETISRHVTPASDLDPKESGDAAGQFLTSLADKITGQSAVNGTGATETSFRAIIALKNAGNRWELIGEKSAARLLLASATIARNLANNPAFPSQNRPGLAPYVLAEARAHALLGNSDGAAESVRTALEWGLVDFEQVIDDPVLCKTQQFETIRQLAADHRQQYCSKIRGPIRSAIAGFRPFNFDFSLAGRNARRVSKTDFPSEVLVVDLWATWCSPCRASVPHLNRLHDEYSARGVKVLGIAFEQGSSTSANQTQLDKFVKQNQVRYMCLLGDDTIQGQIPGKGGMPTLVFINRQGQVRFCTSGFHDYSQISTIVEELLVENQDEQE